MNDLHRFQFLRRVAFGIRADGALPSDPLAWASAQLEKAPPIKILDAKGQERARQLQADSEHPRIDDGLSQRLECR